MSQQQQHKWGYSGGLIGPNEWPKYFHTGQYQSPINILVNNCKHVTQSTCCHHHSGEAAESYQVKQKIQRDHQRSVHEARLHDRLKSSLRIGSNRRAHLDSAGEDHHRSLSTSSSGSQNSSTSSSSPDHKGNKNNNNNNNDDDNTSGGSSNNSSDYDQDGFEDEEEKNDKHTLTTLSSSSSSETTTIRYNEYKRQQHQTNTCCVTQVQNTRHCVSRKKIFLGYPRYLNAMQLCNTGHNWQVNLPPEIATHTRKCLQSIPHF